jgi:hypothetical protein
MSSDFRRAYTAGQDADRAKVRRWMRWLFLLGILVLVTVERIYAPPLYALIALGAAWILLMLVCVRVWRRAAEK